MDPKIFLANYLDAFGPSAALPFVFWYSDTPAGSTERINGCLFKCLPRVRSGEVVSLSAETVGCGGGKFYCGFAPMAEHIPNFVSLKERYISTPEEFLSYIGRMGIRLIERPYLNLARVDRIESFEDKEGVLFLATPDVLSGLTAWAFFDNVSEDSVSTLFSSGCGSAFTFATLENRRGGRRTFLGGFDLSVRPHLDANELMLAIPMSRFREMYATMRQSCLFDTHAWQKVRDRLQNR